MIVLDGWDVARVNVRGSSGRRATKWSRMRLCVFFLNCDSDLMFQAAGAYSTPDSFFEGAHGFLPQLPVAYDAQMIASM